jgi:hypothetical protein
LLWQKFSTILAGNNPALRKESSMRVANAIVLGSVVTLALQTAPVLAKSSDAPKRDDRATSSPCKSYVQNPDGSWTEVSCHGMGAPAQTQPKSPPRKDDEDS